MTPRRFFVLTTTRSGSTWLLSLLNSQPGVAAFEELFLWRRVRPEMAWLAEGSPERYFVRRETIGGSRLTRVLRYLREVEAHRPDAQSIGFKLMISQLHHAPDLLPLLALRRYRLILLLRANHFESVVSAMVVDQTDNPHGKDDQAGPRSLSLDPDELVRRIRVRRQRFLVMRAIKTLWPAPSIEVGYDDLVADQEGTVRGILRTIGVEQAPTPVQSPLTKRIRRPYSELIENFSAVATRMRQAGYGDLLPGD